eukprot:3245051-Prymnesium_polylepis.1
MPDVRSSALASFTLRPCMAGTLRTCGRRRRAPSSWADGKVWLVVGRPAKDGHGHALRAAVRAREGARVLQEVVESVGALVVAEG